MSFPLVTDWQPVNVYLTEKEMAADSYKIYLLVLKFLQDMTKC